MSYELSQEMTKFPFSVNPNHTLTEALTIMRGGQFRHLPITEDNKLVGIVSERDILRSKLSDDSPIEKVMVNEPFMVYADEDLAHVTEVMAEKQYGCALVINSSEQVVGIFTTVDALKLLNRILSKDPEFYNSFENTMQVKEAFEWI